MFSLLFFVSDGEKCPLTYPLNGTHGMKKVATTCYVITEKNPLELTSQNTNNNNNTQHHSNSLFSIIGYTFNMFIRNNIFMASIVAFATMMATCFNNDVEAFSLTTTNNLHVLHSTDKLSRTTTFTKPSFLSSDNKDEMTPTTTALQAAKKKGGEEKPKQELDLTKTLILFFTPWKNPNSIFVYLFVIVYILGKINESGAAAN